MIGNSEPKSIPLINRLDSLLPQTQCRLCGYSACRPYATAMAHSEADINRCPPGGEHTIKAIAKMLGSEFKPLDPEIGEYKAKSFVKIIEKECIGCTLCIQACPVDAIVGAAKQMHTVIDDECTGCDLCVSPCPVDCIDIVPIQAAIKPWEMNTWGQVQDKKKSDIARKRYNFRQARLSTEKLNKNQKHRTRERIELNKLSMTNKTAVIEAAVRRFLDKKSKQGKLQ